MSSEKQLNSARFALTGKGYHQALRNDSHSLWTLFCSETRPTHDSKSLLPQTCTSQQIQIQLQTIPNSKLPASTRHTDEIPFAKATEEVLDGLGEEGSKNEGSTTQRGGAEEVKKKQMIEEYIKAQVPFTRTLSNSAFTKFYNKACPEGYGRNHQPLSSASKKTHNLQPHSYSNRPKSNQSHHSALNFAKRTKIDLHERWKRIERVLSKSLDFRARIQAIAEPIQVQKNLEKIAIKTSKEVNNLQQKSHQNTKRTKSEEKDTNPSLSLEKTGQKTKRQPYFIYKYSDCTEGYCSTRYARDRHGITCYIDSAFQENEEAHLQFLKAISPILPAPCKAEDVNLDAIRISNWQESKKSNEPKHYLIAYDSKRYSRKTKVD